RRGRARRAWTKPCGVCSRPAGRSRWQRSRNRCVGPRRWRPRGCMWKRWICVSLTRYYLARRRTMTAMAERLEGRLRELHLPAMRASYQALAAQAQQETLSYEDYLLALAERECQERHR